MCYREIVIYFDNLKEKKQKEVLRDFGIERLEEMNLGVFPLAIIPVDPYMQKYPYGVRIHSDEAYNPTTHIVLEDAYSRTSRVCPGKYLHSHETEPVHALYRTEHLRDLTKLHRIFPTIILEFGTNAIIKTTQRSSKGWELICWISPAIDN